jgi:tripeptidyl-peptidase-1
VDYITPGIKLFSEKRRPAPSVDLEKRIFGVTSGKGKADLLEPLLAPLLMSVEQLLALPALSACGTVITPACIKALYNVTVPTTAHAGNQ